MHPKAKKRIAILAVAVVSIGLVGGGAFVYRKLAIRSEFAGYRAAGLEAAAKGDHPAAIENLVKYMGRNGNDVEVLSAFAKSREQVVAPGAGHLRSVLGALTRVVSLDPSRNDDRARLAMLLSDFGQLPEALDQSERLLQARPDDKTGLAVKAVVLNRMRKVPEAEAAALKWAEGAPEDVRSLALALATARENKATPEKMTELATKLEGLAKSDLGLASVRGTHALLRGDVDNARKWWLEAAKAPPTTPEEAVFVADQLRGLGLSMESAEYLVKASEAGKLRSGKILPARRLLELERFDLMARLLAPVKVDDPEVSAEILSLKAIAMAGTGDLAGSDVVVKALGEKKGKGAEAWILVSNAYLGRGEADSETTKKVLTEAMQEGENAPVLALVLADALGRLGETERAIRVFDNLGEASPGWSRPMERKAHYLSSAGQLQAALEAADQAARRAPNDPRALTTLARVWSAAVESGIVNNRAQLSDFLEKLSAAMPGDQSTAAMRVVTLQRAGKTADAKKVIDQVLAAAKAAPGPAWGSTILRVATASAAVGLGGEVALIDTAEQYGGVTPQSSLTRALIGINAGQAAEAIARFERERKTDGPDARDWALGWASVLESAGDPRALAAWTSVVESNKTVLTVQREALASRVVRGNLPLRTMAVENLKTLSGDTSPAYRIEEAALVMDQADPGTAKLSEVSDKLSEVVRASPGNVQARVLLARVLERMGSLGAAIEQLRAVSPTAPESGAVTLMLAELLQKRGDFAAAKKLLDDAVTRTGVGEGQTRGAAILLAQQGDVAASLELLKRGGNDAPDPLRVQLYRQNNDLPKAEVEARRVVEAAPSVGSIQALAEIMRARGNTAGAMTTLQMLDTLKLEPGVKELSLTDFHLRFFDLNNALASARQATEKAPDKGATWQALLTVQSAMGDVAGAMATVEAAASKLPNEPLFAAQKSRLELIKASSRDPVLTPLVIALLRNPNDEAVLDAMRTPTSGSIADGGPGVAVGRLRELAAKYPLSQPVQLMAVRRFLQLNQHTEAAALAARAGQAFPTSGEAPALAASAYAFAGDWPQALAQSKEWRNRSGGNPLPADLAISEALVRMGRFDEAIVVVEPYIKNFSADRQAFLPAVFRKTEAQSLAGQDDRAMTTLSAVTKGDPGAWASWLGYVAERMPPKKTAYWATRAEGSAEGSNADLAWQAAVAKATALTALKSPNAAEAREKVATLANQPGRGGQYLASAALAFDAADDLPRAEALYRQAIAAGVDGVALKNNLAMILLRKGGPTAEAAQLAEQAVAGAPNVGAFLDTLASVQAAAGDFSKAEQTLTTAVNLEPAVAEWRIHLAEIQIKAGRLPEARTTVQGLDFARPESLPPAIRNRLDAARTAVLPPG